MRTRAGPTSDYELHMSWDTDPSWIRDGDWVLWVDIGSEPNEVWPPMRCIGRDSAGGRSRQIVSWFRLLAAADNQPWDDVRGRVLARTGRRLAMNRRNRSADLVTEIFHIWGINPDS